MNDYLSLQAAGEHLGLPAEEIYRLVRTGELRGVLVQDPRGWWVLREDVLGYQGQSTEQDR